MLSTASPPTGRHVNPYTLPTRTSSPVDVASRSSSPSGSSSAASLPSQRGNATRCHTETAVHTAADSPARETGTSTVGEGEARSSESVRGEALGMKRRRPDRSRPAPGEAGEPNGATGGREATAAVTYSRRDVVSIAFPGGRVGPPPETSSTPKSSTPFPKPRSENHPRTPVPALPAVPRCPSTTPTTASVSFSAAWGVAAEFGKMSAGGGKSDRGGRRRRRRRSRGALHDPPLPERSGPLGAGLRRCRGRRRDLVLEPLSRRPERHGNLGDRQAGGIGRAPVQGVQRGVAPGDRAGGSSWRP